MKPVPQDEVGLCRRCIHSRLVPTPRATYWRCALAETDPRFVRYPRLPVLQCAGFTPAPETQHGPDEDPSGP